MRFIHSLALAVILPVVAGCTSFTRDADAPTLSRSAAWGVAPLLNYAQAPQAGERAEQILLSVLAEEGLRPRAYPLQGLQDPLLLEDQQRQQKVLAWARQQKLDYVVTGSVEEWQYKNGLDGEPAVGITLQVLEPASGRLLWSRSGARAGWSRESLAGAAQKVLRELVGDLDVE